MQLARSVAGICPGKPKPKPKASNRRTCQWLCSSHRQGAETAFAVGPIESSYDRSEPTEPETEPLWRP